MTIDLEPFKGHTPGKWEWWTSCSWRRLKSDLGHGASANVAEPYTARDGHPNLMINTADMALIAAAPALLSEVRRLKEALEPFAKAANDQDKARAASAFLADQRASQMRSLGFAEDDLTRARSALSSSPVEKEKT